MLSNPANEAAAKNRSLDAELTDAVAALVRKSKDRRVSEVNPVDQITFDRDQIRSGLQDVRQSLPEQTEALYVVVEMAVQQLGNDTGVLSVADFDRAFDLAVYQLRMGVDFNGLSLTEAEGVQGAIFIAHVDPLKHQSCSMFKRLHGDYVGKSRSFYNELKDRFSDVIRACITHPGSDKFVNGVLSKHYESLYNREMADRVFSYETECEVAIEDLRGKIGSVRTILPGESEEFYDLCQAIASYISSEAMVGTAIAEKLSQLEKHAAYYGQEEHAVFRAVVNTLMKDHGIQFEALIPALENLEEYLPDLTYQATFVVESMAKDLEYDHPHHRTIATTGVVPASTFYSIAAIVLERAANFEDGFINTKIAGLAGGAKNELLSQLPKLAQAVGGEAFEAAVSSELTKVRRERENHDRYKMFAKQALSG